MEQKSKHNFWVVEKVNCNKDWFVFRDTLPFVTEITVWSTDGHIYASESLTTEEDDYFENLINYESRTLYRK